MSIIAAAVPAVADDCTAVGVEDDVIEHLLERLALLQFGPVTPGSEDSRSEPLDVYGFEVRQWAGIGQGREVGSELVPLTTKLPKTPAQLGDISRDLGECEETLAEPGDLGALRLQPVALLGDPPARGGP